MGEKIKLEKVCLTSTFLDPRRNFQPTTVEFQIRRDPLTGRTGHFSHFGAIKTQKLDWEKYTDPQVKGFCPFCREYRDKATPKFREGVLPEGRLARGEALLVPNLYPYDVYSAVVIMTEDHVVPLDQFSRERLVNAFNVGIDFLRRVKSLDPSLPYHIMAWNYMPPSGGGLVHPHQQYFATNYPGNRFMDELRAAEEFYTRYQNDYWSELVAEEQKRGERYIGQTGRVHWLTSFVSLGILGEIVGVFLDVFNVGDFAPDHLEDLVVGLMNIFSYFNDNGICSFNATLFFGPKGQRFFPAHFRIIPRTFLNLRDYAPDMSFFQTLLQEPVSVVLPEELCAEVRRYFAR